MEILKIIILTYEFFGFAWAFRRLTNFPLVIAPPAIASIIILILYCADFVIGLKTIAVSIHLIGIVCFMLCLLQTIKNTSALDYKQSPISTSLSLIPSLYINLILTLLLMVFLYFLDRGGAFRAWDEFSHWGSVIRLVFEANSFHLQPNPLYCQDYPPGTALFAYYIILLMGYSERNAYFSFSLLLLCYLAPLISAAFNAKLVPYSPKKTHLANLIQFKNIAFGLFISILVFYLVVALGNGWASVLIDHVVSVVLGGSIIAYFIAQNNKQTLLFIPIMLCVLVLLKHVGSSLAIFAALVCTLDWFIVRSTTSQTIIPNFKLIKINYLDVLWLIALFLLPLLTSWSWKYYVLHGQLRQTWGAMSLSAFFKNSLSCCTTPREIDVAGHFFATLFSLDKAYNQAGTLGAFFGEALGRLNISKLILMSAELAVGKIMLVLSLLGISASFFFSTAQQRLRFILLNTALTIGFIFYSGSLLLAYLYGFSDYEAKILTSFPRYHYVFLLAWALILVYQMIELLSDVYVKKMQRTLVFLILVLIAIWALYPRTGDVLRYVKHGAWGESEQRTQVKEFVQPLVNQIPKAAKVYIAWYGSNGWEFWMSKYELLPRITNLDCFSLGPKINAQDLYTCEFKTALVKNYEYFLIGKGLQVLIKNHNSLFSGVPQGIDQGLLKIVNGRNELKLIYISKV